MSGDILLVLWVCIVTTFMDDIMETIRDRYKASVLTFLPHFMQDWMKSSWLRRFEPDPLKKGHLRPKKGTGSRGFFTGSGTAGTSSRVSS